MSIQAFEIPVTSGTPQSFSVSLGGVIYNLQVRWNNVSQCWVIDLFDGSGNPLLQGVPLVTGCDLLGQYAYLGIPGQLIVQTDHDAFSVPSYSTLGNTGHLYYVVTA